MGLFNTYFLFYVCGLKKKKDFNCSFVLLCLNLLLLIMTAVSKDSITNQSAFGREINYRKQI